MKSKNDLIDLGRRLTEARLAQKLSQPQLAKAIAASKQLVAAWEAGKTEMKATQLLACARALHIDPSLLLNDVGQRSQDLTTNLELPVGTDDELRAALAEGTEPKISSSVRLPCASYCYVMPDFSMCPHLVPGDILLIEHGAEPQPGKFVLAVVFADNGGQAYLPEVVVRSVRYRSRGAFDLVPVLRSFPTIKINAPADAAIVGVVSAVIRQRY